MEKMRYKGLLERRGLKRLLDEVNNPINILDIQKALRYIEMTDVSQLLTIKGLFDYNLPEFYKHIADNEDTTAMWASLYKELFELLGYTVELVTIESEAGLHRVITRVNMGDLRFDVRRSKTSVGGIRTSQRINEFIQELNKSHKNVRLRKIDSVKCIKMNTYVFEIYQELLGFVHSIAKGNLEHYTIKNIDNLYLSDKCSSLFDRDII